MRLLRRRYGDGGDIRYCGPSVGQKENEIRFNKRSENMCQFKSGIILKSKVVIAPGENESHSDLLETLGIRDDYLNATKTFVRAELVPENNEWWVNPEEHPEKWNFVVDQDITPDWFDQDEFEKVFREAVCAWWKEHVLVDQKINELNSGFYRLKRCEVKKLCNDVGVLCDSSTVGEMCDNSTVGKMLDSSTVGEMRGSSTVGEMWDSSTARDFKSYPNVKIFIPKNGNFEMVVHKTEKE